MSDEFKFEISLSVLNHLGRNLYRNFITVLAEAVSNSWDAGANNVWVEIDENGSSFSIKDDGVGMSASDFQNKFLKIGYSKRKADGPKSSAGRPYIGAKGIGKLALLSCAQRVSVFSKEKGGDYTGGVIDNAGLDVAIKNDNTADQYPLEGLNFTLIDKLSIGHEQGTIIVFQGMKERLKSSTQHLKKMLALSFKFSLIDPSFTIHVNGAPVGEDDLKDLSDATEFVWLINGYADSYLATLTKLKSTSIPVTTELNIKGFVATVAKPRDLKIIGTDERATIDLFVNGRLREKNIIRHIPTQRIVESYVYGQVHFDTLDREGADPFTSSREGIVEDDAEFQELIKYLKEILLPKVIDEWDELRLGRGEEGDDENPRKSRKQRRARDLYNLSADDYAPDDEDAARDKVDEWLGDLRGDAEFNIQTYVDCFLSENLVRKYLEEKGVTLQGGVKQEADDWRKTEEARRAEANISFEIRRSSNDLDYLGMSALAVTAEGGNKSGKGQALWKDAIAYIPVRNVVGHTGLLTQTAKNHLSTTYENIKARVRALLKSA
ncbi:MAG: ATP-binding protein [Proteobacteria bacterium]|nr:ATP-binding protein [Pseudomonadota bacterium]